MGHKAPLVSGTGILGGFFPRGTLGKEGCGGRKHQENPTGALSLPSAGFWGPGEQEWGSGVWWDRALSSPGRVCASQPQGRQEYPAPVRMEKQEKVRKIGRNWGKNYPEVVTCPWTNPWFHLPDPASTPIILSWIMALFSLPKNAFLPLPLPHPWNRLFFHKATPFQGVEKVLSTFVPHARAPCRCSQPRTSGTQPGECT